MIAPLKYGTGISLIDNIIYLDTDGLYQFLLLPASVQLVPNDLGEGRPRCASEIFLTSSSVPLQV